MKVTIKYFDFIWRVLWPLKRRIVSLISLDFILGFFALITPFLVKLQTDQLQHSNQELFGWIEGSPMMIFLWIILLDFLLSLLEQALGTWYSYWKEHLHFDVTREAESMYFSKMEKLDSGFFGNVRNRRMARIINSTSYLFRRLLEVAPRILRDLISVFGILPIILWLDYRIGIFAISLVLLKFWLDRVKTTKDNAVIAMRDNVKEDSWELRSMLFAEFQQISMIDQGRKVINTYNQRRLKEFKLSRIDYRHQVNWQFLFWFIERFSSTIITVAFGLQVMEGRFSLGDFTMIVLYVNQIKNAGQSLLMIANEWLRLKVDFLKIGFFMHLKPKYKLIEPLEKVGDCSVLTITDLVFRYPALDLDEKKYLSFLLDAQGVSHQKAGKYFGDTEELEDWKKLFESSTKDNPLILKNLNLTLKKGSMTALIGRNGAGKTTLINLLLKMYDYENGSIVLDGVNYVHLEPIELRKKISLITQQNYLLESFSIRENVTLGVEREVSDEEIWQALALVDLRRAFEEDGLSLDAKMGEDVQLSGGQKQLLSIVRVYLQRRPMVIFDEGTNQLDAEHENLVMEILKEMKKYSIVLMITHKLTSARKADQIYVLDEGCIVEAGDHQTLLGQGGLYQKFWNLQVLD